jgi:hypothetical protein
VALAAALAVVAVVLPLKLQEDAGQARPVASARVEPTPSASASRPAPAGGSDAASSGAAVEAATAARDDRTSPGNSLLATETGDAAAPKPEQAAPPATATASSGALAFTESGIREDTSTGLDISTPPTAPAVASATPSAEPDAGIATATTAELERLYAESAQLEGLLALARGDGVANGAAAALAGELDARVARIDAALVQPALSPERRVALWRERVDALRQAAAFESTQRLLAARGERYDALLVSID